MGRKQGTEGQEEECVHYLRTFFNIARRDVHIRVHIENVVGGKNAVQCGMKKQGTSELV